MQRLTQAYLPSRLSFEHFFSPFRFGEAQIFQIQRSLDLCLLVLNLEKKPTWNGASYLFLLEQIVAFSEGIILSEGL